MSFGSKIGEQRRLELRGQSEPKRTFASKASSFLAVAIISSQSHYHSITHLSDKSTNLAGWYHCSGVRTTYSSRSEPAHLPAFQLTTASRWRLGPKKSVYQSTCLHSGELVLPGAEENVVWKPFVRTRRRDCTPRMHQNRCPDLSFP